MNDKKREFAKLPNWNFWKHSPQTKPWQACALALNFDPDVLNRHPQNWMSHGAGIFQGFPSDEAEQQHAELMKLLIANQFNKQHFKQNFAMGVSLSEFAAWCAPVVRDLYGRDIPLELAALTKATQAAPLVEAATADNHDETLAALFDPVAVEELEKMFAANGKWKSWAEKAKANGLIDARKSTAMFNPYKAGVWFVRRGVEGWDTARLYRTLANNLPARSRDDAHLLTGGMD